MLATAMAALAVAAPSRAGEPVSAAGGVIWTRPVETGKPAILTPTPSQPPAPPTGDTCPPALPCGARLIGSVQKNGAVELQVPAWRW